MRWAQSLSAQILALQLGIIALAAAAGAVGVLQTTNRRLTHEYGQRALAVAESVANVPAVRDAFDDPDPSATIQPLAESVRSASATTFVVVTDARGVRYSHPNPDRIGEPVSTAPVALSGRPWVGVETGTLGRSVRAKTPLRDRDGNIIGQVSVGILTEEVSAALRHQLPELGVPTGLAALVSAAGSMLLARRVKRQTLDLEPRGIAALYEQREAMLAGVREGVVGIDAHGRLTLANGEARRLLDLPGDCTGKDIDALILPARVRDLLLGRIGGADEPLLAGGRVLIANRMPVAVRGCNVGWVITLRDHTELETLVRELASVRSSSNTLRAQAHEFANRLQVLAGLIELSRRDEALTFIAEVTGWQQSQTEALAAQLGDPVLIALLLAKGALATEQGAELHVTEDSRLPGPLPDPDAVVTVIGNLIDNALEAIRPNGGGRVEVSLHAHQDCLIMSVTDTGPGLSPDERREIFADGYTTKGGGRGLGLALVAQATQRLGGSVDVTSGPGARFTVTIPTALSASSAPSVAG